MSYWPPFEMACVGASLVPKFANRAKLVLDQTQDIKAVICKLKK
jgi:hypothetical protein